MTLKTKAQIKSQFETDDKPTEQDFSDWIDAMHSKLGTHHIIVEPGEDILAKYGEAKVLKASLDPSESVVMFITPGDYELSDTWELDEDDINVIGLGAVPLDRGCEPKVVITGDRIYVSADKVYIQGIWLIGNNALLCETNKPNHTYYMVRCNSSAFGFYTDPQFSEQGVASGKYINCQSGNLSFGGTASGTFINCLSGTSSYGYQGTATGTFINCKGGNTCFATDGDASGTFINCEGGIDCFGDGGDATGYFRGCIAGMRSYGQRDASGTFIDCVGGDWCFAGSDGSAIGTFINCRAGSGSFGGGDDGSVSASARLYNCTASGVSFGSGEYGGMQGRLYYCHLIGGDIIANVFGAGEVYHCVDITGAVTEQLG